MYLLIFIKYNVNNFCFIIFLQLYTQWLYYRVCTTHQLLCGIHKLKIITLVADHVDTMQDCVVYKCLCVGWDGTI